MWDAVKNAAAGIWGKVTGKPQAPAKPVNYTPIPLGAGSANPQQTSNPQGGAPSPQHTDNPQLTSTAPIQGSGTNPNTQLSTVYLQQQAAAAAAARKAAALAAAQKQKLSLASIWKTTLTKANQAINAPADFYWKKRQKQIDTEYLQQQNDNILGQANAWRRKADVAVSKARQDLANGVISPTEYDTIVAKERDKLVNKAAYYNNDYQKTQASIDAPITGNIPSALNTFSKVTKPISLAGSAAWTVFNKVTEAPSRLYNTVGNLISPKRGIDTGTTPLPPVPHWSDFVAEARAQGKPVDQALAKEFDKKMSAWAKAQEDALPKVGYSGSVWNHIRQAWNASANQNIVSRAGNLTQQSPLESTATNLLVDPLNFTPAGLDEKLANKGAAFAAKAGSKLSELSTKKTALGYTVAAGKKVLEPFGKALGWLNSPVPTTFSRNLGKYQKNAARDFKALTNDEVKAWQIYNDTGRLAKASKTVDPGKITAFADKYRAAQDARYASDIKSGVKFERGYRNNYRPLLSDYTKKLTPDEIAALPKNVQPFYSKSRKLTKAPIYGRDQAITAEAVRAYTGDKFAKRLPSQRFLSTDTSALRRASGAPTRLWKKAVLKYNPAWYVHNVGWNIPASILAGADVKSYGKLIKAAVKERTLSPTLLDKLPREVVTTGLFGTGVGKTSLGSKVENFSRAAAYLGATDKGFSNENAIKKVNKYLFDYGTHKNWERPFKAVNPFFQWTKNITRLTAQLPFSNPRFSVAVNAIKKNLMDKPLQDIPNQDISYTNPESGQQASYNPRAQFEGKIKTPWGWINPTFLPILPKQLQQIGENPWLQVAKRLATGKDYYGNSVGGESFGSAAGSVVPQVKLIQNATKLGSNPSENWVSSSGYGKTAQGFDPSKPNYKTNLDPTKQFWSNVKSFSGVPSFTNFDEQKFRDGVRYKQFSDAYFKVDWHKEYPDYQARQDAQAAFAQKFGYDINKDLYNGKWSKYDSPATIASKARKQAAVQLQDEIYAVYNKLPKGTGARSKFIQQWKTQLGSKEFLDFNPDFNVFKNTPIEADPSLGKVKTTKFGTPTPVSAKAAFWQKYYATTDKAARRALLAANPSYSKYPPSATDSKNAKIAWAYRNLPPDVRKNYLKKNGLTDSSRDNWTSAQWDEWLKANGKDPATKLGNDLLNVPELGQKQLDNVNKIITSFNPIRKDNSRPVTITSPRRRANPWKPLTYSKR